MVDRDTYLRKAAYCREKAKTVPAQADYWTDQAINWLQRAVQNGGGETITHEVRDGRMIPKPGK